MNSKRFVTVIGCVFSIVVFAGVCFVNKNGFEFFASNAKSSSKNSWEAARPVFEQQFSADLQESKFQLDDQTVRKYLDCKSNALIAWLGTTSCTYQTDSIITDKEVAAQKLDVCKLANDQWAKKRSEIDATCTVSIIPNDWNVIGKGISLEFSKKFTDELSSRGLTLGADFTNCVANDFFRLLSETNCKPLNLSATNSENIISECVSSVQIQIAQSEEIKAAVSRCVKAVH